MDSKPWQSAKDSRVATSSASSCGEVCAQVYLPATASMPPDGVVVRGASVQRRDHTPVARRSATSCSAARVRDSRDGALLAGSGRSNCARPGQLRGGALNPAPPPDFSPRGRWSVRAGACDEFVHYWQTEAAMREYGESPRLGGATDRGDRGFPRPRDCRVCGPCRPRAGVASPAFCRPKRRGHGRSRGTPGMGCNSHG